MQKVEQKLFILFLIIALMSCRKDSLPPINYQTKNVIVVVIDGARYSETWGDPSHQYIPRLANQLAMNGLINTNFYNNGATYTVPGHTAITTSNYQGINNGGSELPQYPSIFQYWLEAYNKAPSASWVIASKDKLEVLSNCKEAEWNDKYNPSTNCGVNGLGSGYRNDSITYDKTIEVLSTHHPQLVLINFREPDYSAHDNNWDNYTKGILDSDEYLYKIWSFIENDSFYRSTTTLFVTNDHGRHLDNIGGGFAAHGDGCEGCRHINFFAAGPDFKQDCIIGTERELIDIPVTIAELLHFQIPNSHGEIMFELFK